MRGQPYYILLERSLISGIREFSAYGRPTPLSIEVGNKMTINHIKAIEPKDISPPSRREDRYKDPVLPTVPGKRIASAKGYRVPVKKSTGSLTILIVGKGYTKAVRAKGGPCKRKRYEDRF